MCARGGESNPTLSLRKLRGRPSFVPGGRFELPHSCEYSVLNAACLPFQHPGKNTSRRKGYYTRLLTITGLSGTLKQDHEIILEGYCCNSNLWYTRVSYWKTNLASLNRHVPYRFPDSFFHSTFNIRIRIFWIGCFLFTFRMEVCEKTLWERQKTCISCVHLIHLATNKLVAS